MQDFTSTPNLQWLIEHLGFRRTYEVCTQFSHSRVFVPSIGKNVRSEFNTFLTNKEREAFSENWGGMHIRIPLARPFCIKFLSEVDRLSASEIARCLKMTETGVEKSLSRNRKPLRILYPFGQRAGEANVA